MSARRPACHATDNGRKKQEVDSSIRDKYTEGDYKNFNLKKQGDGMFWAAVPNPNEPDKAKAQSCTELPFWVKNGEQPDVPGAIDTKVLAALAYQAINVPDTEVELSPKNKQTVHLPTWAWLNKATFKPVSVTASVDLGGGQKLSATTTAKPGALSLDPGTQDADLHPASGKCPAKNGTIGTPYTKGNTKKTPPCGLTYLRSTLKGESYALKASVIWQAAWKGSDGTFDNEQSSPSPADDVGAHAYVLGPGAAAAGHRQSRLTGWISLTVTGSSVTDSSSGMGPGVCLVGAGFQPES